MSINRSSALVVLDGELAVPCNPRSAYAGLKVLYKILETGCPSVAFGGEVDLT